MIASILSRSRHFAHKLASSGRSSGASRSGLRMPLLRLMRAGGIAATCALFRMERGVTEIVVDVVGPDAMPRDAQLPHAPAGMEFEPVIPVLGKLDGMLCGAGRNGFRLGKPTSRLNWRKDGFAWLLSALRCPSSGH